MPARGPPPRSRVSLWGRGLAFTLPDTDGTPVSLGDEVTVVVFTCNHCPYALGWHERIQDVARDYAGRATVLQINPNDALRYPRDSAQAMKARVDNGEFAGPYLVDESQEVARAYDAKTTPDVFVLVNGEVVYRGAPDGDPRDPAHNAEWLRAALDDVLAGRPVSQPRTTPVGCSIKWR